MYYPRIKILVNFYQDLISEFVQKEIEIGKPKPEDKEDSNDKKQNSMYYDLFESKEVKKSTIMSNLNADNNFTINRGIIQNLHFFFGAFCGFLDDQQEIEKELLFNPDTNLPE